MPCGTCRCRVLEGEVHELTESGYLLSGAELDQGYVLACQCVPRSDVAVEAKLPRGAGASAPAVAGGDPGAGRVQAAPPASALGLLHYLKYFLFHAIGAAAVVGLVAGAEVVVPLLVAVVGFYVLGDALAGDDVSTPTFRHPGVLTVQLWRSRGSSPARSGARRSSRSSTTSSTTASSASRARR